MLTMPKKCKRCNIGELLWCGGVANANNPLIDILCCDNKECEQVLRKEPNGTETVIKISHHDEICKQPRCSHFKYQHEQIKDDLKLTCRIIDKHNTPCPCKLFVSKTP